MSFPVSPILSLAALLSACAASPSRPTDPPRPVADPVVHQYAAGEAGIFVNAWLVEGERGVVAVDSTLTVSDATALRAKLDEIGKPLLAVLLTHGHPTTTTAQASSSATPRSRSSPPPGSTR